MRKFYEIHAVLCVTCSPSQNPRQTNITEPFLKTVINKITLYTSRGYELPFLAFKNNATKRNHQKKDMYITGCDE